MTTLWLRGKTLLDLLWNVPEMNQESLENTLNNRLMATAWERRTSFYERFIIFKLWSIKKIHAQKHTVGIYYLDSGGPSRLFGVFLSFGVLRQSNGYNNSRVPACWDLLWGPTSSASIPNECPSSPVGCQLSVPLVKRRRKSTQKTLNPSRSMDQRRAANDPYDGLGQPLFGLHYPQRDKQSFVVSLDMGWKKQISQTFILHRGN